MTDCPVCNNEVPLGAPRCKHCFSDLAAYWDGSSRKKTRGPLIGVTLLLLLFLAAGFWVYYSVFNRTQLGLVTIDPELERIVLVYTSTNAEPTTNQIRFGEVASIEMEAGAYFLGGNHWSVYVVTTGGERVLVNRSEEVPLESYANNIAQHTNKQLTIINNIKAGQDIRRQN